MASLAGLSQTYGYPTQNFPNGYYTVTLSFTSADRLERLRHEQLECRGSWSSNVPFYNNSPPAGCTAMFGANGSGTVVLPGSGAATYVNTLVFANSSNSYTLRAGAGGSTLEFLPSATKAGGGAIPEGAAFVEVVSGSHTIAANAQLDGALDVSTLDRAAAMRFSGALSGTGGLVLSGEGSVTLSSDNNSYTGGTTVDGGTLYLDDSGALPHGSSLTVGAGGSQIFNQLLEGARIESAGAVASSVSSVPEPGSLATLGPLRSSAWHTRGWRRRAGRSRSDRRW